MHIHNQTKTPSKEDTSGTEHIHENRYTLQISESALSYTQHAYLQYIP